MSFWKHGYIDVSFTKEQTHNEQKTTKVIWATVERTHWKEPRLERQPFTGRSRRFRVCARGGGRGGLWFCVQGEPQMGRHGSWALSPQPVLYLNKILVARAWREQRCPCKWTSGLGQRASSWGYGSLETRKSFSSVVKHSVKRGVVTMTDLGHHPLGSNVNFV